MSRAIIHRVAPWLTTLALVLLWWFVVVAFHVEKFVLPTPAETLNALFAYRASLATQALATLTVTLLGFGLAVVFGLALGILVGSFRLAYAALFPVLIAFNSVPKAAIVPVLVIWFGVGSVPSIVTAFMLSFFPVAVNVALGFATIEPELLDVLRSLGATPRDMILKVGIPRSMPYFFGSLKISIALAFVGSIVAEIVAGNSGIGNVMLVASSDFNVPLVFAALVVVGIMGTGMYGIFAWFENRVTGWSVRGRGGIEYAGGG